MAPRVLVAVLVYNGRPFVPRCLRSAARLREEQEQVDVLVLDDCSPEPGWSDELRDLCRSMQIGYYRSPRNLGIPRNMNLALLQAKARYDHVVIANSDVIFPSNLVRSLVGVAEVDARIASVTPWSNSASIYSLPNRDPERNLSDEETVDWLSETLEASFGRRALDVPSAVGFCMLIPVWAIEKVGLFDPVFRRGYCEEVDWSQRARSYGYRVVLAPGVFVYHEGFASTRSAGLLRAGEITVWAHERIVDLRHPSFRADVDTFLASKALDKMQADATRRIIRHAAQSRGYSIEASWLPGRDVDGTAVRFTVEPDGRRPLVSAQFLGFSTGVDVDGAPVTHAVSAFVGRPPQRVGVFDRGHQADLLSREAEEAGIELEDRKGYPERI
ncbi:MAG: glycosyltransferase family 2 protein [Actinomycetota bacterium]